MGTWPGFISYAWANVDPHTLPRVSRWDSEANGKNGVRKWKEWCDGAGIGAHLISIEAAAGKVLASSSPGVIAVAE